jgi:integrase
MSSIAIGAVRDAVNPQTKEDNMAEVNRRSWKAPGQRTKRKAWGFSLMVNGRQVRSYRAEWTKEQAQEALAKVLLKIEQPKPEVPGMTLGDAVERYLLAKARKKSIAEIERVLEGFKRDFGADTPLASITASRLSEWEAARLATMSRQTGRLLSQASVNRPLASLRALLRMARDKWEVLAKVPHMKLEREDQSRLRWLTSEEATRLLVACRASRNPHLVDLVEFCLFTGLRQAEALELTWDRVERARGVVLLEITKNGRRREVPLNGPADGVLVRRGPQDGGLVFGARSFDRFRSAWETAVSRAKLADFRFHDLRHTFASWAVQRGATLQEVKDLLGHSSLAMVMRYAHLSPEHLRSAVARLDGVLAAPESLSASAQTQRTEPTESVSPVGVSQKSL